MRTKDKSIKITNPSLGRSDSKVDTIAEMKQDCMYRIAQFMKDELEKPRNDMLWPRTWRISIENGKNKGVVAKLIIQQFQDVKSSFEQVREILGEDLCARKQNRPAKDDDESTYISKTVPTEFVDFGKKKNGKQSAYLMVDNSLLAGNEVE